MKHLIKTITLLLISVTSILQLAAAPITQQQAQQNVQTFLETKGRSSVVSALRLTQPKFTSTNIEYYYVFNIGENDGYVIAAGDDCAPAILGYSDSGSVDMDSMPENMKAWLEEYVSQIEYMQEHQLVASPKLTTSYNAISPLMTTTWDQQEPYNQNCPDFFSYGKSVTGCVATAMAQVMYYHRANSVTQTTAQIPAYDCLTLWLNGSDTLGHIHVDAIPAGSPIDWGNMLNSYSGSSTTAQQQAVSNLMKYCGASVQMNYANAWSGGSGAYSSDVPIALKSYFNYSDDTTLKYRSDYSTNDAWENLIYNELSNSRPVYYSGRNSSGGHAFVCDGYDGSGYYHINWGWSGTSDGYFLLTALDPNQQGTGGTSSGYNQNQAAVINAQPKSSSPSNPILATSISLNKTSATVIEGNTTQLSATVLPDNASNKTVSWTTSNSTVATVDNNGLVTAIASGTATITATTTDGTNLSVTCEVTVISATDFTFHIDDIEGFAGSTISIPIELDNDYGVKAFMFDFYYPEGFRVTDYSKTDRMNTDASISGLNHPEENFYRLSAICVSTNTVLSIGSGPIISFKVHIPEDAIGDYEICLKNIQIVPESGKVLFPSDISANLTVRNVPATAIQLDQSSAMVYKGESLQLTATVSPDEATYKTVNWSSSDETIATVDENGLVTALAVGKATIIATTIDGSDLSASCEVTVKDDLSNYDNYLSLSDAEAFQGDTMVIPVAMTNTESIISFQTDIFMPEGLEIVQEDGEYIIDASDRMTRTHSIVCNDIASGAIRVMCYSSNYKPFTGNSGDDLFYITVKVADDARGDYNILLRNTLFTNSDFEEIAAPDVLANVTVNGYKLGDANGSGTITVTDVVVTSQYVLEQNPYPFIFWAADVNADGNITVTDVSRIAWMVLNPSLGVPRRAPVLWNNGDCMSGEGITIAAGETRTVSIALDNEMDYSAFQLDLALPEGLTAGNFRLTDRAGCHAFDVNTLANGKTRALCYSPTLTAIRGNEGAVLTFDVTATTAIDGVINIDGIELVTTDCQTVCLDAFTIGVNSATTVSETVAGKTIAKVEYYNVAGQRLDRPESGVTLVVTTYTDGTRSTTKFIK